MDRFYKLLWVQEVEQMHAELDITIRRILHVREKECQVDLLVNAARDQRLDSRHAYPV